VPLQTILCNPEKIDHNFKLERPVTLSSYRVLSEEIDFIKAEDLNE
jgi:hypothetical protein